MKEFMTKHTIGIRHWIVRKIAPTLYHTRSMSVPRPMILYLKSVLGSKPVVGVEVGVAEGVNAESILKTLNVQKLYLVDPYEAYIEYNKVMTNFLGACNKARERLEKFCGKICFLRMTSDEAAQHVPEHLDFVYIDGNHSYEYVKHDIENYYPKVRQGGVIGGHDFWGDEIGLVKAVMEFAFKNGLEVIGRGTDWWIQN